MKAPILRRSNRRRVPAAKPDRHARGGIGSESRGPDDDAKALAIVTPGALGPAFFGEAAAILDAAAGGPPDLAAIAAVMGHHGLTPAS